MKLISVGIKRSPGKIDRVFGIYEFYSEWVSTLQAYKENVHYLFFYGSVTRNIRFQNHYTKHRVYAPKTVVYIPPGLKVLIGKTQGKGYEPVENFEYEYPEIFNQLEIKVVLELLKL